MQRVRDDNPGAEYCQEHRCRTDQRSTRYVRFAGLNLAGQPADPLFHQIARDESNRAEGSWLGTFPEGDIENG